MTAPERSPGRGILLLVLTFLTGLGVGWSTYELLPGTTEHSEILMQGSELTETGTTPADGTADAADGAPVADEVTSEAALEGGPLDGLDLDAGQRAAVDSILASVAEVTDSVLDESRATLARRAERARLGIVEVLDDEQAAAFERRLEELGGLRIRRVRRVPVVVDSADEASPDAAPDAQNDTVASDDPGGGELP